MQLRSSFSRAFGKNKSRDSSADGQTNKDKNKKRSKSATREPLSYMSGAQKYAPEGYQWSMERRDYRVMSIEDVEYNPNPYQRSVSSSA